MVAKSCAAGVARAVGRAPSGEAALRTLVRATDYE